MSPIAISVLAFALMILGILAGGWVQGRLPERHLSSDSKEVDREFEHARATNLFFIVRYAMPDWPC